MKTYRINAERAESTLLAALTGIRARANYTPDSAEELALVKAHRALMAAPTEFFKGSYIAFVPGWVIGAVRGAGIGNAARWAARGCHNVA